MQSLFNLVAALLCARLPAKSKSASDHRTGSTEAARNVRAGRIEAEVNASLSCLLPMTDRPSTREGGAATSTPRMWYRSRGSCLPWWREPHSWPRSSGHTATAISSKRPSTWLSPKRNSPANQKHLAGLRLRWSTRPDSRASSAGEALAERSSAANRRRAPAHASHEQVRVLAARCTLRRFGEVSPARTRAKKSFDYAQKTSSRALGPLSAWYSSPQWVGSSI
jgi:hypothetical protein